MHSVVWQSKKYLTALTASCAKHVEFVAVGHGNSPGNVTISALLSIIEKYSVCMRLLYLVI